MGLAPAADRSRRGSAARRDRAPHRAGAGTDGEIRGRPESERVVRRLTWPRPDRFSQLPGFWRSIPDIATSAKRTGRTRSALRPAREADNEPNPAILELRP